MKIVSWGIIFVIVIFSFSFINRVILNDKMEIMKEEVNYNNTLELAVGDATTELKAQMNSIMGTYNETQEMMLTVAKKFFDSFSIGFGYYGGNSKESLVKMYIPALTMMTYDGFYMYTLDYVTDNAGNQYIEHTLKPEVKYVYNDSESKINFTLDNSIILNENVQIIDYSNPVMEPVYAKDEAGNDVFDADGNKVIIGYEQKKDPSTGNLIYYLKDTNTGRVVDLNHYYDIEIRSDSSWQQEIGGKTFTFRKEGNLCYTSNEAYEADVNKVIVYEKSFYNLNGIRYLLEEWRIKATDELIEQRMTEYTEEQLVFSQSIEANISNKYGETNEITSGGYLVWETDKLNPSKEYITYLTRGNSENEGFVNPLTGEYEIGEFHKVRREVITKQIKDNLEYYILLHNKFAENNGITYTFTVPEVKDTDWENAITDMSVFAFVQGIPMVSGEYYNNYGIAGAKVINKELFYGLPPETAQIEPGKVPTYYSSRHIGSAKTYLFERNNARVFDNPKDAADYGYYPNIDGNIEQVEELERDVWDIDIIKEGFNCIKAGDVISIPIILSDDIIPSEIKWVQGEESRYYFSSAGNAKNIGTKRVQYDAGKVLDTAVDITVQDGTNISWQYAQREGKRVVFIVLNAGYAPTSVGTTSYTIFIRDMEGNSKVATISLNIVNNNDMIISQTSSKTDNDTDPNNTITGTFSYRNWSNLLKEDTPNNKDLDLTNDTYMAYWAKGKLNGLTIESYYETLLQGNSVSGVNELNQTGTNSWSFNVNEYGYYTVFVWDCTGEPWVGEIIILPELKVTYRIDAYGPDIATGNNMLIETIEYDELGNIISGSTEIEQQIDYGKVYIEINRTLEQLKYVEYKKGNFDVTANASAGIEAYVPNTGTNIKGINTFDLTENNYYTVYVEDVISAKECVQINFELITSAFIPNFNNWIIPDLEYQKKEKSVTNTWYCDVNMDDPSCILGTHYDIVNHSKGTIKSRETGSRFEPIIRTQNTLTFGGYESESYSDIIFTNADPKYEIVFRYTINDADVSYHSSKGAGFLFDCNVTTTTRSDGYKNYTLNSAYLLLYEKSSINLYRVNSSSNLTGVRNSSLSLVSTGNSSTKLSGGIHETRLEIRQINDTQQKLVLKEKNSSGNWQELINTTISHNKQTENAYGVIMKHSSHACEYVSAFKFNNMSIIQKDYAN
ncbi:MAG: hypothetical protein E7311_01805 [Clostridiales bacterium]|nr:hypothetical protein [Clostridiales bacterium]